MSAREVGVSRWTFRLIAALTVVLAAVTAGALVAMFVFGYSAALSPGSDPEQRDAALVSFFLTLVAGALAAGGGLCCALLDEATP